MGRYRQYVPDTLTDSPSTAVTLPDVATLLRAAVAAVGGSERPGQVRMAEAVAHSIRSGEHLAVQAGTGTGKSLAYLVPAIRHAVAEGATVVVSTATIALQRQLVDRDLPRLATALKPLLGRAPTFAILKGRRNYLCLHKVHGEVPDEPEDQALFDPFAASALGRQVKRLHEWSSDTETGDLVERVRVVAWFPGPPVAVLQRLGPGTVIRLPGHIIRVEVGERVRDSQVSAGVDQVEDV